MDCRHGSFPGLRQTLSATLAVTLLAGPAPVRAAAPETPPAISPQRAAAAVKNAQPGVSEPRAWAADILAALSGNRLPANRENVCAVIAVIAQESGFRANPAVPGLGRKAERELSAKAEALAGHFGMPALKDVALWYLENTPDPRQSLLRRVRAAQTEYDLDKVFRDLVGFLPGNLPGELAKPMMAFNKITTLGPMQVSAAFAVEYEERRRGRSLTLAEIYAVRDALYTRKGGVFFGTAQLLGYDSGYSRKLFRFADYNAGRYSSRNAALQKALARLSELALPADGDLLMYDAAGTVRDAASRTERAALAASDRHGLGLDAARIRRDFLREKRRELEATPTYAALRGAQVRRYGGYEPAAVPDIALRSAKLSRPMTTADFARRVEVRYRACLEALSRPADGAAAPVRATAPEPSNSPPGGRS